jgi:NAD(P)-dependent dehydrogenase (short-subunit alcohol dehydrogenase family)
VCRRLLPDWEVIIIDLQQGPDIAADLEKQRGGRVVAYGADISDEDAVREIFSRVTADFSQAVRGLVNSAAIYSEAEPGHGTDEDELRLFRVNVLGAQHQVNAAVPLMAKPACS